MATATFVGMLLGATFWGGLADRFGRRVGFQATVAVFTVFGTASAFAPDPVSLALLRGLTGFGLGGALPLDFSLYAEFLPARNRGRRLVVLESFWALGTVDRGRRRARLGAGPDRGLAPLLASTALLGPLLFWIRRQVPESPRWLAAAGRGPEAAAVLREVAVTNGVPWSASTVAVAPRARPARPADLWSRELRRSTALYAYTPELYPTSVRATGVGWASGASRIAGAAAPLVGGLLLPVSLTVALVPYAAGFLVAAAAVLLLGRETRATALDS